MNRILFLTVTAIWQASNHIKSSNDWLNLSQTCNLFCISNEHHDIIVFASCFKTNTPSSQPQETSHDCPCWRTWLPGRNQSIEPKTSQTPRRYWVCSLILAGSIFLSSFTFVFVNLFIICSYIFPVHLFSVRWSLRITTLIWPCGPSEAFPSSNPLDQTFRFGESPRPLVSLNRFDWIFQNSKLKNHASLEELRWDHSEEKIRYRT